MNQSLGTFGALHSAGEGYSMEIELDVPASLPPVEVLCQSSGKRMSLVEGEEELVPL